jgi:hypothetical protein
VKFTDDHYRLVDSLCKVTTAIALIVAGYWGYHKFIREELPVLEIRARTTSRILWDPIGKDACSALFDVKLENIGTTLFTVRRVNVTGWLTQRKVPEGQGVVAFDVHALEKTEPFYRQSFTSGSFVARFPAGTWDRDTFEWWFRRPADDSQLLYLKISFVDDNDRMMAFESDWDVICGGAPTVTRRRDLSPTID